MLFSRHKVAYERKRKIMRNVASVAELTRSFFAEIDKVDNPKSVNRYFKWTVIRLYVQMTARGSVRMITSELLK